MNDHDDHISIGEAAEILGISQQMLRRYGHTFGITIHVRSSGHRVYRRDECEALRDKREETFSEVRELVEKRSGLIGEVQDINAQIEEKKVLTQGM